MIFKKTTNKIKKFLVAAILSISMTGVATAAVEWNTAVTSEYIWRGMSQGKGAAVSGGIDVSGETGFSAGVWVSNVDFGDNATYELDLYAGYSFGPVSVGYIYYAYPDNTDAGYDFSEVNLGDVKRSYKRPAIELKKTNKKLPDVSVELFKEYTDVRTPFYEDKKQKGLDDNE